MAVSAQFHSPDVNFKSPAASARRAFYSAIGKFSMCEWLKDAEHSCNKEMQKTKILLAFFHAQMKSAPCFTYAVSQKQACSRTIDYSFTMMSSKTSSNAFRSLGLNVPHSPSCIICTAFSWENAFLYTLSAVSASYTSATDTT